MKAVPSSNYFRSKWHAALVFSLLQLTIVCWLFHSSSSSVVIIVISSINLPVIKPHKRKEKLSSHIAKSVGTGCRWWLCWAFHKPSRFALNAFLYNFSPRFWLSVWWFELCLESPEKIRQQQNSYKIKDDSCTEVGCFRKWGVLILPCICITSYKIPLLPKTLAQCSTHAFLNKIRKKVSWVFDKILTKSIEKNKLKLTLVFGILFSPAVTVPVPLLLAPRK